MTLLLSLWLFFSGMRVYEREYVTIVLQINSILSGSEDVWEARLQDVLDDPTCQAGVHNHVDIGSYPILIYECL